MTRLEIDVEGDACSFCGKGGPPRRAIIMLPLHRARICEVCIGLCAEILGEDLTALRRPEDPHAFQPPSVDDPAFVDHLVRIVDAIEEEIAARGQAFGDDVLRAKKPEYVPDPHRGNNSCLFGANNDGATARSMTTW
jgi:hypothetical protein